MPRGAKGLEGWAPRLEPVRGRRGAGEGATDPDDARLLPVGGWTRNIDQEEAPEARELKPSRAQRAALEAAGLHHDRGAGTFFGVTTTAIDDFPAGSLIFSEPEDGAGFAIAKAELAPAGGGKARKARAADAARADAALAALSNAPAGRSTNAAQEGTTAAQIEAAAEVLAETPVGPEGESGAAGVSFADWQKIERALVNLLDAPDKSTQHRVGRALEAWRDGLAPGAEHPNAKPSPGNRGWAVLSLDELHAELDRVLDNSVDDDDTNKQTHAYMTQVLSGFEAVTPPFAAAFALVAAARKHIANPKCKDEAREQSRAALAKAVDTLEAAATRRRAGGLPADQLAELRASARSVALTAAKLARSCAAGQLAMPANKPTAKAESGAKEGKASGGDPYATPQARFIGARKVAVQAAGRGKDALSIDTGKWSWTVERTHPIVEKLRSAPLPPLPLPGKPDGWTKAEWQGWASALGRALGLAAGEFDVQWVPAEGVSKEGWQLVIPRGHTQHGRSAVELTFELALNQLMFVGVVEAPVIQKGDVVSYIKGRTRVVGTVLRVGEVDAAVLAAHTITAANVRFVRLRLATEAEKAAAYGQAAEVAEATPTSGKLPTDWSELPAWAEGWYRANGLSRNVPELAKRLTHHLFTGTFDDIVDPNINKVGAAAVQVLLGREQPFKTAKAMKELFVGVPVLRLTGNVPAERAPVTGRDPLVSFVTVSDEPSPKRGAAARTADKDAIIATAAQNAMKDVLADMFG